MVVVDIFAYVTGSSSNSLAVVDVSTPSNPQLSGSLIDSTNMKAGLEEADYDVTVLVRVVPYRI